MKKPGLKAVTFYVTEEDFEMLQAEAEGHGCSVSYFVHAVITKYSPVKLQPVRQRGGQEANQNAKKKRPDQ